MSTPILLGIHGKARSGKDTLCQLLQSIHPFQRMAFADPLKKAAGILFDLDPTRLFEDEFKAMYHSYWGTTVRDIYQRVGTEAMRGTFGDDFWLRRWEIEYSRLPKGSSVVVTDVRFENEADHIRKLGGVVVHIVRPQRQTLEAQAELHLSEMGISQHKFDYGISNHGTLDDLKKSAALVLLNRFGVEAQ